MAWKKPLPELVNRFTAALPTHPDAEPKKMFGYPACFVKGSFFVGLHEEHFVIRLPGALKDQFPELATAVRFDPRGTGKGMKDWWVVPMAIAGDDQRLADLFQTTFQAVQQLPPQPGKVKRAGATPARRKRAKKAVDFEG